MFTRKKKGSLLVLITIWLCVYNTSGLAQWKAVCTKWIITDTVYNIRSDNAFEMDGSFRFPEYSFSDYMPAIYGAIECPVGRQAVVFEKMLNKGMALKGDSSVIFFRLYTKNVKSYVLWWYSSKEKIWRNHDVALPFSGYQIPTFETPANWKPANASELFPGRHPSPQQDQLLIMLQLIDTAQPARFVIGNLAAGYRQPVGLRVSHPFFYSLSPVYQHAAATDNQLMLPAMYSEYLTKIPQGLDEHGLSSRIDIVPESDNGSLDNRTLLKKIITASLEYYPFFKEHNLDKNTVIHVVNEFFADPALTDYCSLLKQLAQYIKHTFNDFHFYIDLPAEGNCTVKPTPVVKPAIRVAEIKEKICISARFDTAYRNIHLDDEVVSIDGIDMRSLIDSLSISLYGSKQPSAYKKFLVINALLDRTRNDTCTIVTKKLGASTLYSTVLHYNRPYEIPRNFQSLHAVYKRYNDVGYFKIKYWEEAVYLLFINHWDDISQCKKLIIDLRGNGGGELTAAMQLFSIFIDRPHPYFKLASLHGTTETVMVQPDPAFSFPSSRKVIILGNEGTACASETFIKAMQSRRNTWYSAAGRSAGSLAAKYDIRLPDGVIVHVNGLQRKICYTSAFDVLENRGIEPDLPVVIEQVNDLFPYNDKVLKQAINFLSADNRVLPKTE